MLPKAIAKHRTLITYLIAGGYNTVFGFAVFTGLFILLEADLHYLGIAIITQIISITNSYIVYRVFVFKSRGSIINEYFRIYIVYGISFILGIALLTLLVEFAGLHPVLAQFFVIIITVIVSYIGNRRFTFNQRYL